MYGYRFTTKDLSRVSIFIALIAVGAFIKIPVPNMPFTLQFLFTNLAGIILGSSLGAISVLIYICMGLIGIPVFTSGGGPAYVLQPTFGYLVGFVLGTFLCGKFLKGKECSSKNIFIASIINLSVVYILGMVYYYFISNYVLNIPFSVWNVVKFCFLLAVPGDILLCFVSTIMGKRLVNIINK